MDSVFALNTEEELAFDVMFDQEDSLIDTVNGVNEAGEPLTGVDFEELHQTEDEDVTPKDIKDELGEGNDVKNGAPNPEGSKDPEQLDTSVKGEVGKKSDTDKFIDGAEDEYQDGKEGPKPDEDSVTDTIDKVIESKDIDDILDADDEDDIVAADEAAKDIDSILDPVNETETGADSDVNAVVKDEESTDNQDIDNVLDGDNSDSTSTNLDYDVSDEELIDMVSNGIDKEDDL